MEPLDAEVGTSQVEDGEWALHALAQLHPAEVHSHLGMGGEGGDWSQSLTLEGNSDRPRVQIGGVDHEPMLESPAVSRCEDQVHLPFLARIHLQRSAVN